MNIDIKQIRMVEALARHGNFARAAKELHLTQPGLSRAIKSLELSLDVTLFDRGKREVSPTAYACHIIQFGTPLIRDARRLVRDLQLIRGNDAGELTIGTGIIPAEAIIGKVIGRLNKLHPRLHIRVIVERPHALFEMLRQGQIDILIADTRGNEMAEDIEVTPMPQHSICFIVRPGHPLISQKYLELGHIFGYPIATPWLPENIFPILATKTGMDPAFLAKFENGLIECNNFKILLEVVRHSDAVGCGLDRIYSPALAEGEVVALPLGNAGLSTHYGLVNLKRYSASPSMELFKSLLLETIQEN
jgi:DNA-binding transcriptional LysR family regulator